MVLEVDNITIHDILSHKFKLFNFKRPDHEDCMTLVDLWIPVMIALSILNQ